MIEVGLGAIVFTGIVLCMVLLVLLARQVLVVRGEVAVLVNDGSAFRASIGSKLLTALVENGVPVPAACGGSGTCGLCRVHVTRGGGSPGPIEVACLAAADLGAGARLACQVVLREDIEVRVSAELAGSKSFACVVRKTRNVATFIKELELALPSGMRLDFRAGAFVQITCPAYTARFADFHIDPPFEAEWERLGLRSLRAEARHPTTRAYSLANHPGEEGLVLLDVRIATPPPGSAASVPPGVVSSWIFNLVPGDRVTVAGPFGHFFATDSDREMVLVGGGAGMAPMRSHVFDQLEGRRTGRKITFGYGARSARELFYVEDFDRLQREHANFRWLTALSDPRPDDDWDGHVGFIHQVLYEQYLAQHPAPRDCEYYLCGPPMMIQETRRMLERLGVDPADVHHDDFGGQS